jgi:hypothetical protein
MSQPTFPTFLKDSATRLEFTTHKLKCPTNKLFLFCGVGCAVSRSTKVSRHALRLNRRICFAICFSWNFMEAYNTAESTLKRHGYYCRTRNGSGPKSRMRSCVACAKAKARCDNTFPTCSRCTAKNLPCHHTGRISSKGVRLGKSGVDQQNVECHQQFCIPSFNEAHPPSVHIDSEFLEPLTFGFENVGTEELVWDIYDAEKAGTQCPNQLNLKTSLPISIDTPHDQAVIRTPYIPEMPSYGLRSFAQKPASRGGGRMTATLIFRILTSYPAMLRDHKSPPPFVHPSFLNFENRSMDSLTTCSSLMQMLGSGGEGSRSLLWKNVRLECERLQAQVRAAYNQRIE